ncbi:MAG TPA: hypothetical protein VLG37_04410 [Candidatus Saccharimonadales bacterium]|nr:hypothetical protein [Candidatus Saccharimonadales bacterium]
MPAELATLEQLSELLADPAAAVPRDMSFFVCEVGAYKEQTELKELIDPYTGLPFLLAPTEETLPKDDGEVANWHHGTHPRAHHVLATLGGKAMRCSQIQLVKVEQHNQGPDAYHNFKVGPWIHRQIGHQVGMCLAAAAGVPSRLVIHTKGGELQLKPTTEAQLAQLTVQGEPSEVTPTDVEAFKAKYELDLPFEAVEALLKERRRQQADFLYRDVRYGYGALREFLGDYVISQDLSNVNRGIKNRLIVTGDESTGVELLAIATEEAVRNTVTYNGETVEQFYRRLQAAGRLHPLMPATATKLVKYKLGDPRIIRQLIASFRDRLTEQAAA